jgi:hypothetical protein
LHITLETFSLSGSNSIAGEEEKKVGKINSDKITGKDFREV